MEFSITDRVALLNVLPKEGDIRTLKLMRKLREDLSFSEKEIQDFKIKVEGGMMMWDAAVAQCVDIEIGPTMLEVIRNSFETLNKQKMLKEIHIDLYDRFVKEE